MGVLPSSTQECCRQGADTTILRCCDVEWNDPAHAGQQRTRCRAAQPPSLVHWMACPCLVCSPVPTLPGTVRSAKAPSSRYTVRPVSPCVLSNSSTCSSLGSSGHCGLYPARTTCSGLSPSGAGPGSGCCCSNTGCPAAAAAAASVAGDGPDLGVSPCIPSCSCGCCQESCCLRSLPEPVSE